MATDLQRLADELKSNADWRERRRAAKALGRSGDQKWAGALLQALDDGDPDVVAGAIDGLVRLGERRATTKLRRPKVIGSRDPVVRWLALQALGRLGGEEIVESVVKLLDDPEWVVRNEARRILRRRVSALASDPKVEKLPFLVRLLSVRDEEVRSAVVAALGNLGLEATHALVEALEIPSVHVREGAARALGQIRDPSSVPALSGACRDEDPAVRRAAAWALGYIVGSKGAVEALIGILADSSRDVAEEAAGALVRIGEPAVPHLIESLRHVRSERARQNIVRVLGRLGDERALRVLLEHLGDSRFLVRSAAIEAVTAFGDRAVASLIEMLVPSTVPTEPLLREASEASSQRVRLRAMQALGELRNPNAVSGLKVLAEDPDPQVAAAAEDALSMVGCAAWGRACAAVALGSLRAKRAVRPLLRSLRDPSHNVRSAAVRALGKTGDWRFFRAIGSVLAKDQDPEVRAEAALVLQRSGRRGKGCVQATLTAMADESRVVRRRAATALGRYQDAAAVPALVAGLADRYWSVRRDCENALANLGRAAVPGLLASLRKADQPVGRSILGILVRIRPPDLSACLQKEIPRIREAALREGAESVVAELSQSAPPRNNTRPSPR